MSATRKWGRWAAAAAAAATLLAIPHPAAAKTTVGEAFPPAGCMMTAGRTFIQSASPGNQYTTPAGVITSWSHVGGTAPQQVKLKIARAAGGDNFTIVASSDLQTAVESTPQEYSVNTFPARIPVEQGDLLGMYFGLEGPCGHTGIPGYVFHYLEADPPPGVTSTYDTFGIGFGIQLDVSAVVEPDADADGFGDESQDGCAVEADTQGACVPPETTITKRPKNKTKTRKAVFEFSSSDAGSAFECSIDGAAFVICSSPLAKRVRPGKHSLQVRAIDPGGLVDRSEAGDFWRVKRG